MHHCNEKDCSGSGRDSHCPDHTIWTNQVIIQNIVSLSEPALSISRFIDDTINDDMIDQEQNTSNVPLKDVDSGNVDTHEDDARMTVI